MSTTAVAARSVPSDLSVTHLHLMRGGYLLMGVGLVLVKWPLLPMLLFESAWKLWLSLVALPRAAGGGLDAATSDVAVNCSLVVVILAVIPWRYVWRTYVRSAGDRWR